MNYDQCCDCRKSNTLIYNRGSFFCLHHTVDVLPEREAFKVISKLGDTSKSELSVGFILGNKRLRIVYYVNMILAFFFLTVPTFQYAHSLYRLNCTVSVRYFEVDLCNLEDVKSVCSQLINEKLIPDVLLFNGECSCPAFLFPLSRH